jgi:hypothetical protein
LDYTIYSNIIWAAFTGLLFFFFLLGLLNYLIFRDDPNCSNLELFRQRNCCRNCLYCIFIFLIIISALTGIPQFCLLSRDYFFKEEFIKGILKVNIFLLLTDIFCLIYYIVEFISLISIDLNTSDLRNYTYNRNISIIALCLYCFYVLINSFFIYSIRKKSKQEFEEELKRLAEIRDSNLNNNISNNYSNDGKEVITKENYLTINLNGQ